ncbi:MAG: asparagine--tRNA ligase [Candidatus Nanoarchaeia archaeon]
MDYLSIQEAMDQGEGDVAIRGWCHRVRGSGKVRFIVLRDSTNTIQCIVKKEDVPENVWDEAQKITHESSLELYGEIKKDERAPTGFEVLVRDLKLVGKSDTFPIQKDQSTEFLLDKRHLWLRSQKITAVLKVRSTVFGAIDEFFRNQKYTEVQAPIFTPAACEGGSTLFEVKYFDDVAYLTQSWQLYAEAMIAGLEKIYCISPCFRSEKSKTSRHLAEFWMAEMEAAWIKLDGATKVAEELIEFIVQKVIKTNLLELQILKRDLSKLNHIKAPFHRMTYTEVLEKLKEKDNLNIEWGKDLRTIEEDTLMKHFDKPVIVTNYPKETMAFYKPADPSHPETALCFDMLAPEGYGEIIGGSERELDEQALIEGLKKQGENVEDYEWYLDTRRYGAVPHSGFGLGVERVVAWICGLENIKDAIPFPRTMLRMKP